MAGQVANQIPKLCDWVEDNIEKTLTYYPLPLQHHGRDTGLGGCDEILAHVLVVQDIDHNIGHDARYTHYRSPSATNMREGWHKKANGVTT
jgi:hypothetical protein